MKIEKTRIHISERSFRRSRRHAIFNSLQHRWRKLWFILYTVTLSFESRVLVTSCTTSLTVTNHFFLVVMFNALHKVFLTFEFVHKYPWVWPSIAACNYKGIQDSLTFWIPRNGFRTPGIGFQIAIVSGIPNSLSLITDSGSHKQNFPDSELHKWKFSRIPDSISKKSRDTGIRIPLKGVTWKKKEKKQKKLQSSTFLCWLFSRCTRWIYNSFVTVNDILRCIESLP